MNLDYTARAQAIWTAMDDNERFGVRFGMFPFDKMRAAESDGFKGHQLCVALMDLAKCDGGMIA